MRTDADLSLNGIEQTMRLVAAERWAERLTHLTAETGLVLEAFRTQHTGDWARLVPIVRAMPGFATFQEDPLTNRAYARPRGYPGDAGLLDLIYRPEIVARRRVTQAGLAIFRAMTAAAAPTAVRNRQTIVAHLVDTAALDLGRPLRVASLGCGHLAEAEKMASLDAGMVERFWALDQDPRSIAEVQRRLPYPEIVGAPLSVGEFLRGHHGGVNGLDFFYAAGLFDYLQDRAARCLVRRMFDRLRPGGTLLVANFVTGIPDRAYMEAIMDWWLVYRTEKDVAALDAEIEASRIASKRTFVEPAGNIAFLELRRN